MLKKFCLSKHMGSDKSTRLARSSMEEDESWEATCLVALCSWAGRFKDYLYTYMGLLCVNNRDKGAEQIALLYSQHLCKV